MPFVQVKRPFVEPHQVVAVICPRLAVQHLPSRSDPRYVWHCRGGSVTPRRPASREWPVLVVGLHEDRGRRFRAVASHIHSIEHNLSIANLDFFEFADDVEIDGVFRGF